MGVWTSRARFAHSMIDPLLDNVYVNSVQVTTTEAFDLADRGWFSDRTGAICDGRRRRGGAARQALQRR